jgi:hypothetical protein
MAARKSGSNLGIALGLAVFAGLSFATPLLFTSGPIKPELSSKSDKPLPRQAVMRGAYMNTCVPRATESYCYLRLCSAIDSLPETLLNTTHYTTLWQGQQGHRSRRSQPS